MELSSGSRMSTIKKTKDRAKVDVFSYLRLVNFFFWMIFLVSATISLPTLIQLGSTSFSAVITIVFAVLAWLFWFFVPILTRKVATILTPFLIFLCWVLLSNAWGSGAIQGLQNQTVWLGFVGLICLSGHVSYQTPNFCRKFRRLLSVSTWIAVGLFLVVFSKSYTGWDIPLDIGFRQFALFALLPLSWHLAAWKLGNIKSLGIALGIITVIILSLSRMATLAAIIMFILAVTISKPKYVTGRLLLMGALGTIMLLVLFTQYEPLVNRDQQYAVNSELWFRVGNIEIYGSGRVRMWSVTIESIGKSPLLGQGPGSSAEVLLATIGTLEHPHNDYLRILHDYGIIGLLLFLYWFVFILNYLWKHWRKPLRHIERQSKQLYGATLLLLTGFALAMFTDNLVVYSFLMFPLGILIGASAGLASRERQLRKLSIA